jgi:hypothetical protein
MKLASLLIHLGYSGKNLGQTMLIFCPPILKSLFFTRIWVLSFLNIQMRMLGIPFKKLVDFGAQLKGNDSLK